MNLRIIWPGKTKDESLRRLQNRYLEKIVRIVRCEIIETRAAKGIDEKFVHRILEVEAESVEQNLGDGLIVCLCDKGKEMTSLDLARFLERQGSGSGRPLTFVVGGFVGLAERLLRRADLLLALSRMTFSHELSRIILLEQLYRSLTLIKGQRYAK